MVCSKQYQAPFHKSVAYFSKTLIVVSSSSGTINSHSECLSVRDKCMRVQLCKYIASYIPYCRKVWWKESLANLENHPWFTKLKPSKLVHTINNLLADLLICQTFFHQMLKKSKFIKFPPCQTIPLYGTCIHSAQKVWPWETTIKLSILPMFYQGHSYFLHVVDIFIYVHKKRIASYQY